MTSHWQFLTSSGANQPTAHDQNAQQQSTLWSYINLADNSATTAPGPYDYAHAGTQAPAQQSFASYGQVAQNFSGQHQQAQPNKPHQENNYFVPQQADPHPPAMNQPASFQPYTYQDDANAAYSYNFNQKDSSAAEYEAQSHQQQYYPVEPRHQHQHQHQQQHYQPQSDQFPHVGDSHHAQESARKSEEAPVFHEDQQGASQPVNEEANGHQVDGGGGGWDSEGWNDSRRSSAQNDIDWTNQRQRSRTASTEPQPFASHPHAEESQPFAAHSEIPQMTNNDQQAYAAQQDFVQTTAPQEEHWNDWDPSSNTSPQAIHHVEQVNQPMKESAWDWEEKEDNEAAAVVQEYNQQPIEPLAEQHAASVDIHLQVHAEHTERPQFEEERENEQYYNRNVLNSADHHQPTNGTVHEHQSVQMPVHVDATPVRRSVDLQQPLAPINTDLHQNGDDDAVFGDFTIKKQVTPETLVDRLRRLSSTEHAKDHDAHSYEQQVTVEDTSVLVMIQNNQNSTSSTSTSVKQPATVQSSAAASFKEEPPKPIKNQEMILERTHDHRLADGPRKETETARNEPLANPKTAHRTGGKDSKSKRIYEKDSYHNRIRSVKQQYPELPEIIERLDKQRATTPHKLDWGTPPKVQPSSYNAQPARKTSKNDQSGAEYAPNNSYPRKNSTPKEVSDHSSFLEPRAPDISAIVPRPRSSMRSGSVDMTANENQASFDWDEQGIDARRKARHRLRPPSRAESEFGGDNTASRRRHSEYDRYYYHGGNRHPHPHTGGRYTPNLSYGGGSHGGGGYSRHHSHYEPRPRPHSAFDREAYERERGRMHEAGYRYEPYEDDDSESRSGETGSESATEEELAEYEHEHSRQRRRPLAPHDPRDLYYFYVIRLPNDLITHGLRRFPPPRGYESLAPIEKAAYLYYFSLYRKYMSPVAFRKIFAYQYSRFMLPRDSTPEKALEMIVQWTRAEYDANVLARTTAAYTASQKQLFSDDRETPDSRQSDRGSYNEVADSDRFSVESAAPREPLKFRVPHSFLRFGAGGRAIVIDPTQSIALVEIKDVKSLIVDPDTRREIEVLESFRGPLVAGQTPAHTVRLFVQRQLEKVRQAVARADEDDLVDSQDCLLVWQLLDMVVQQQGRVTGPDLARLLTAGQREDWAKVDGGVTQRSVDPNAHARFTEFLLGGHIEEALDSAVRDGLYADALVMARRIFAGDAHRLDEIEAKFLMTRPIHNPVMTLLSVASNHPAPVLTNPPTNASGGWRPHAAIVLANLSSPTALNTVYHLGKTLARRHRDYAADFCFLAVHLLAGWDVFTPISSSSEEDGGRQHVSLIHATLPGREDPWSARFKWSLIDLQATEVYDYAVKLANPNQLDVVGAQSSVTLQVCKIEYATRLSEYGGFASDTFRYCMEVAKVVWARFADFRSTDILRLCELADCMTQVGAADPGQTAWIESLRSSVAQQPANSAEQQAMPPVGQESTANNESEVSRRQSIASSVVASSHRPSVCVPPPIAEAAQIERHRITSLSDEAASWHGDHQDPIEMHPPNDAAFPPASYEVADGHEMIHRRTSNASAVSSIRPSYGAFPANSRQAPYDYGNSDTGTETAESSPLHQQRHTPIPDVHATPQPFYTPAEQPRPKPPVHHPSVDFRIGPGTSSPDDSVFASPVQQPNPPASAPTAGPPPMLSFASPSPPAERQRPEQPASQLHQQPPPGAQLQRPTAAPKTPVSAPADSKRANGGASGGQPPRVDSGNRIQKWLTKLIPDKNEMKLPDDSKKAIHWDAQLGKWIGDVAADEVTAQPPPVTDHKSAENLAKAVATQGLQATRRSGGSRYFNPSESLSGSLTDTPGPNSAFIQPPAPPVPAAYHGFIPSLPAENGYSDHGAADDYGSPFSTGDPFSYPDPNQQQTEVAK